MPSVFVPIATPQHVPLPLTQSSGVPPLALGTIPISTDPLAIPIQDVTMDLSAAPLFGPPDVRMDLSAAPRFGPPDVRMGPSAAPCSGPLNVRMSLLD